MAKVASARTLPSSLQLGGDPLKVGQKVKRKTPSELRGEQLRRINSTEVNDESSSLNKTGQIHNGSKKQDLPRLPRYVDTRMDGVYAAKKTRFGLPSKNENKKKNSSVEQPFNEQTISGLSNLATDRRQPQRSKESNASFEVFKDDAAPALPASAKHRQGTFTSVTMLSSGGEKLSHLTTVDLDKALKGIAAHEAISNIPNEPSESLDDPSHTRSFCSEFQVPGQNIPLDLTLKTSVQIVSSSSVNWFHRSIKASTFNGVLQDVSQSCQGQNIIHSSETRLTSKVLNAKVFHSWVYPQSTLPSSVMSVLASAAGGVEMDFLRQRQHQWKDSFQSLYYMFRKNAFHIFYVCTPNFVVMFTATDDSKGSRRSCNAYISQSTRSLRSLLKEQDVCFSMPLCHSKIEEGSTEDLVELSEIEKQNLGQARRKNIFSGVDNTSQSLLAFSGNENVHGLYEILLNYRSYLTFLAATDVPTLYSPLPFQNAAMSTPEIKCMEIKIADHVSDHKGSSFKSNDFIQNPHTGVSYCVKIKDNFLPPWIISSICAVMGSEGRSFEASFTTEHTTIGLNVALGDISEKITTEETTDANKQEVSYAFGIPETCVSPHLSSGLLKTLNYSSGSYSVSLSPVQP